MNFIKIILKEIEDNNFFNSQIVENFLNDYNLISKSPMDLIVFGYLIEHLTRICRVLKQSNGHCLLIGYDGTGRSSLTKLAAFAAEYEFVQFEMIKNYNAKNWNTDLKNTIRKGGLQEKSVLLFFSEHQLKEESFLEDICKLLDSNADFMPLFEKEEKLEIIEKVIHSKF